MTRRGARKIRQSAHCLPARSIFIFLGVGIIAFALGRAAPRAARSLSVTLRFCWVESSFYSKRWTLFISLFNSFDILFPRSLVISIQMTSYSFARYALLGRLHLNIFRNLMLRYKCEASPFRNVTFTVYCINLLRRKDAERCLLWNCVLQHKTINRQTCRAAHTRLFRNVSLYAQWSIQKISVHTRVK